MKQTKLFLWYPSFHGVGQGMKQTKLYLWYPSFIGVGRGMEMKDAIYTAWSSSYLDIHQEMKDNIVAA
jgi:hypothetical protein